jgi:hypothetical protein
LTQLSRPIPRTLDDPSRILGLSPLELAVSALSYAILSPILRDVPFGAALSLSISLSVGIGLLVLNRTYPPSHGLFLLLRLFRPQIRPAMGFGINSKDRS